MRDDSPVVGVRESFFFSCSCVAAAGRPGRPGRPGCRGRSAGRLGRSWKSLVESLARFGETIRLFVVSFIRGSCVRWFIRSCVHLFSRCIFHAIIRSFVLSSVIGVRPA